jgi:Homeodomain-like domain
MTVAVFGLLAVCRLRATYSGGPGSVLVELSVVVERYRAVLAVLAGESLTEVAAKVEVSRQTVLTWLSRCRDEGLGGLARWIQAEPRSWRPPSQAPRRCRPA